MSTVLGRERPGRHWRADLNHDGTVDAADIEFMECQYSAGWPDPSCCPPGFQPSIEYPWGWKTRQPAWQDAAIRVFDPVPPHITLPWLPWPFVEGEPIENDEGPWDMAFLLTTPQVPGDMNCDGLVSFFDIDAFVELIVGG